MQRFSMPTFEDVTLGDIAALRAQIHALNNPYKPPHDYMNINPPLEAKAFEDPSVRPQTKREVLQYLLHRLDVASKFMERRDNQGENYAHANVTSVRFALHLVQIAPQL